MLAKELAKVQGEHGLYKLLLSRIGGTLAINSSWLVHGRSRRRTIGHNAAHKHASDGVRLVTHRGTLLEPQAAVSIASQARISAGSDDGSVRLWEETGVKQEQQEGVELAELPRLDHAL